MTLSPKYEKQLQSLREKYRREVELLESQISQARSDKTHLLDLMKAIDFSLESGVQDNELAKQKRQSRLRHAKPEYRGYSFETAVIAILDGQTRGMTITEIAKEMALPESEAINSIYKSVRNVCLRSDELLLRKGDRFYLRDKNYSKKKSVAVDSSVETLATESKVKLEAVEVESSASNVKPDNVVTSKPSPYQEDIFSDLGDFSMRSMQKHYPKKAGAKA